MHLSQTRTMQRCLTQKTPIMNISSSCVNSRLPLPLRVAGLVHLKHNQLRNVVLASAATEQAVAETAEVAVEKKSPITALNTDTFYQFLDDAADTLVVVDFYTDWCGPCKVIYPELVKLAGVYDGRVHFTKVNCNKTNKDLGVKLAIKVAPTFHLYRRSQKVAEMTGAKVEKLKSLIQQNL